MYWKNRKSLSPIKTRLKRSPLISVWIKWWSLTREIKGYPYYSGEFLITRGSPLSLEIWIVSARISSAWPGQCVVAPSLLKRTSVTGRVTCRLWTWWWELGRTDDELAWWRCDIRGIERGRKRAYDVNATRGAIVTVAKPLCSGDYCVRNSNSILIEKRRLNVHVTRLPHHTCTVHGPRPDEQNARRRGVRFDHTACEPFRVTVE